MVFQSEQHNYVSIVCTSTILPKLGTFLYSPCKLMNYLSHMWDEQLIQQTDLSYENVYEQLYLHQQKVHVFETSKYLVRNGSPQL